MNSDYNKGQKDLIDKIKKECLYIVENSDKENMFTDMLIMLMNLEAIEEIEQ